MKSCFEGLAILVPENLPAAEASAPTGRVFILIKDPIPGTDEPYVYFHGIRRPIGQPPQIIFNRLQSMAQPFDRADVCAAFGRFLALRYPEHSITIATRNAQETELRNAPPRWWAHPALVTRLKSASSRPWVEGRPFISVRTGERQ